MGIEVDIRGLLTQGYRPADIVRQGHKKSTVYKVYRDFVVNTVPVTPPQWWVEWEPSKPRYLPGETANFQYSIKNTSGFDLYVFRSGIHPVWLKGEWHAQEMRRVLHPGEALNHTIDFPIPSDLSFGEYELKWGLEGQRVGPGTAVSESIINTEWSDQFVLEVKQPLSGLSIFISHSTHDMRLVREIEEHLDSEGILGVVAEDKDEPGGVLREKFERQIRESEIFFALLTTNGIRSEWVIHETNYAGQINKPMILLKEKDVSLETDREWVEFSRLDPMERTLQIAGEAVTNVKQQGLVSAQPSPLAGALTVGILAFLFGLSAGRSESQ